MFKFTVPSFEAASETPDKTRESGFKKIEGGELNFNFFINYEDRQNVYEIFRRMGDYIYKNNFKKVIIVDRSARPAYLGIKMYLREKYPDFQQPDIYFMNPKGFVTKESLRKRGKDKGWSLNQIFAESIVGNDYAEYPEFVWSNDDVDEELTSKYHKLMENKDEPVLVFDVCIHTGKTIRPMVDALKRSGLNLKIASVSPADAESSIRHDYNVFSTIKLGCHPVGFDYLVEKGFNETSSFPVMAKEEIEHSRLLRSDIKNIVKENIHLDLDD